MTFSKRILSVSTLALAIAAGQAFAAHVDATAEPAYNPATATRVEGTITAVKQVPAGSPMAGVHATLKMKTGTVDVYLGPADFLRFLKVNYPAGDQIEVIGSKVRADNTDVILARYVNDGAAEISLRDSQGRPDWTNWGREIDPSQVQ